MVSVGLSMSLDCDCVVSIVMLPGNHCYGTELSSVSLVPGLNLFSTQVELKNLTITSKYHNGMATHSESSLGPPNDTLQRIIIIICVFPLF